MQFTPQQMAGGAKFSSTTRIGNWAEEIALANEKLKNFQKNSAGGSLVLRKQQLKIDQCTQRVPHSYSDDGLVRFGDTIILQHGSTGKSLACDPFEDTFPGFRRFLVTASSETSPTARNTFVVCRPPMDIRSSDFDPDDPVVRYGQYFMLQCNDSLLLSADGSKMAPPLYLASTQKNERTTTKVTNKQAVYMQESPSADCLWCIQKPSSGRIGSTERFVSTGLPVYANERFVMSHKTTNTFISTNADYMELSDFGHEYEVFTSREFGKGKLSVMASEFSGKTTTGQLTKPTMEENEWLIVTSSNPEDGVDNRILPQAPKFDDLVADMFNCVMSVGIGGFLRLRKDFVDIDAMGDGRVPIREAKKLFQKRGLNMTDGYYDSVFQSIDVKNDGLIYYKELISLLRVPISESRLRLICKAYEALDEEGKEKVPLDTLARAYKTSNHPLVKDGTYGPETMRNIYFRKVVESVHLRLRAPFVTLDSFVDYFSDLSSAISDDEEFQEIFSSMWF